jgi:hypothetical protein
MEVVRAEEVVVVQDVREDALRANFVMDVRMEN